MRNSKTAECVTPKHPDKMCDQISDAILDFCLDEDPKARVAVETMGGHGMVYITGEITMTEGKGHLLNGAIRKAVHDITGKNPMNGEIGVEINIARQSPEIANGVDTGGAGDQGIMRGYAVRETESFMPAEYEYARSLCKFLYAKYPYDGKTQVTMDDNGDVTTIVASFQNANGTELQEAVYEWVEKERVQSTPDVRVLANPAGDWSMGGFDADTGLTGRKLMVDNYGPRYAIGGGAFSGKDATKVDRSAAYIARKIAVDQLKKDDRLVEVQVELAYAIGVAEPVDITIRSLDRMGDWFVGELEEKDGYDLTPNGIIRQLELDHSQYIETASWGHFGQNFKWDK